MKEFKYNIRSHGRFLYGQKYSVFTVLYRLYNCFMKEKRYWGSLVFFLILLLSVTTVASSTEGILVVKDARYEIISIPGGKFQMGADDGESDEYPMHSIYVHGFRMGKTEVTQGLWKAVMGNNPSEFKNGDSYPVDSVSWKDCNAFISKLNQMTGRKYRLPTEAEWEYACRAATATDYHGNLDAIAWYVDNSNGTPHPVGQKQANAFGLYDMTGNVSEWCKDWYNERYQYVSLTTDLGGPIQGSERVIRGGSYEDAAEDIRSASRFRGEPDDTFSSNGFRLTEELEKDEAQIKQEKEAAQNTFNEEYRLTEDLAKNDAEKIDATDVLTVKYARYEMISIPGGKFQMGCNNSDYGESDERPVHTVEVNGFLMGKTEVTQGLWKAVMGHNPSQTQKGDSYPVESVSWNDCQTFIKKLNQMTGEDYRLPTEAEWEYACRAGTTGKYYGKVDDIGWHGGNSDKTCNPVGKKQANAFGLYDMSGNVNEWCQDWYDEFYYSVSPSKNPQGPLSGSDRINRGGNFFLVAWNMRSSDRFEDGPEYYDFDLGFRLAKDFKKNEELKQQEEAMRSRLEKDKIRKKAEDQGIIDGVRNEMVSIPEGEFKMGSDDGEPDERPVHTVRVSGFLMGKTEVSQRLWRAVMGNNPSGFEKDDAYPIDSVSWDDCQAFIKKLNQMTGGNYRLPTEAEWEYACRAGTTTDYYGDIDAIAWHEGNSDGAPNPIGQKQANSFGLYDMTGNLSEWCQDWYDENYYSISPSTNPKGPSSGECRVIRGGNFDENSDLRSAFRSCYNPIYFIYNFGFRLASDSAMPTQPAPNPNKEKK